VEAAILNPDGENVTPAVTVDEPSTLWRPEFLPVTSVNHGRLPGLLSW
jgi:hypothetical protein